MNFENIYLEHVAKELSTQLFEDIFNRLDTIKNLNGYIDRSAKHNVARYSKRIKKQGTSPIDDFEVETQDFKSWQNGLVREDFVLICEQQERVIRNTLPDFDYVVLYIWADNDKLTYEEIGEMLKVSKDKIRLTISRAREKCKRLHEEGRITF